MADASTTATSESREKRSSLVTWTVPEVNARTIGTISGATIFTLWSGDRRSAKLLGAWECSM
jgi:hypothetical protein